MDDCTRLMNNAKYLGRDRDQRLMLKKEFRGIRRQRIRLVFMGEVDGFYHLEYNIEKMEKSKHLIKNAWTYYWSCRKYSSKNMMINK